MRDLNKFPYCCDVTDTRSGITLVQDFECVLIVDEIDTSRDEVRISVSIPGMSAMGDMARAFLAQVCNQAEADEEFIALVMGRNGISTSAHPGSDDAVTWDWN